MKPHEQSLLTAITLAVKLSGNESAAELKAVINDAVADSDQQDVLPLQEDLAVWLKLSLNQASTRLEASRQLWDRIQGQGYTLIDVPATIRRQVFGGSLDIQRRLNSGRQMRLLIRKFRDAVHMIIVIGMLIALAWAAWIVWMMYQAAGS